MSLEDRLYPLLSLYERSPRWLKQTVGRAYRTLPESVRFGRAYGEFCQLAGTLETASPDEVRSWQTAMVRAQLDFAYAHCRFYRERYEAAGVTPADFRSLDDLRFFPTVEKADLQEHLAGLTSDTSVPSRRLRLTTGGSTGFPVAFYLERGVSRPKEQAFLERMWGRAGWRKADRLAVIRGHVTTDRAGGRIASHDPTRDWLMLSSYHLMRARLDEYLNAIARFRPTILHAYPSAALELAHLLEQSGRSWTTPLRALLCGSEGLTLPAKRLLERTFGCRVYRWYGHSERVVLAGEGTRSERFYFFPHYGYVELPPASDDNLCEIIGTSFHNHVMPLIRYRTGDLAEPAPPDAAAEFPWTAVTAIRGRDQEFLVTATGRRISLTAFNMHDGIFDGLYAVQFVQVEAGRAEFLYVPTPDFSTARLAVIERGIRRKLGDDFRLTFRAVAETTKTARGKHKWLVSSLTSGHTPASSSPSHP